MSSPNSLANASVCYCFSTDAQFKQVAIYLLAAKAGLLAMAPSALASAASCYCFDNNTWKGVVTYLLDSINSGGSGAVCVTGGNSAPIGVPPCNHSIWIQGPGPNFGVWFGDVTGWSSVAAIAQGP